jgi:peptide/nickel transport system substrate-binding protein
MITKLRFKAELFWYYLKKNIPFIILGAIFGSLVFFFQDKIVLVYQKINQPVVKIGVEGLYTTNNLPQDISLKISTGLTTISNNSKPEKSFLVKSINATSDHLQYTIDLNPNLFWHDGSKFTASDINYKIAGLKFSAESPTKLKISSDKPFAPLESSLSLPLLKKNLIGLGQYKVQKLTFKDGYVSYLKIKSDKDQIIYRFYQSEKDLLNAFKIGEVDQIQISYLPPELENWPNIKINKSIDTNSRYSALFFNTEKINNKQLRQALAYATPKVTDKNERTISPISPSSWAYNPAVKEYNFNPTKAKEFFEKNPITAISIIVIDRNLLNTAESIKKTWEEILKIKVDLKIENQVDANNFDVVLAYGSIPTDPDQYIFWHSTQNTNVTRINNPKIDKLLEEGRQSFDLVERKKTYQEFQKVILEESPLVFLSYPTVYTINRKP